MCLDMVVGNDGSAFTQQRRLQDHRLLLAQAPARHR